MATAEQKYKKDGITLSLTDNEAIVLYNIIRNIGGHPDTTARGFALRIENALYSAGVQKTLLAKEPNRSSIYFSVSDFGRDVYGNLID